MGVVARGASDTSEVVAVLGGLGVSGPEGVVEPSIRKSSKLILNSNDPLLDERDSGVGDGAVEVGGAGDRGPPKNEELEFGCGLRGGVVREGGGVNVGGEL